MFIRNILAVAIAAVGLLAAAGRVANAAPVTSTEASALSAGMTSASRVLNVHGGWGGHHGGWGGGGWGHHHGFGGGGFGFYGAPFLFAPYAYRPYYGGDYYSRPYYYRRSYGYGGGRCYWRCRQYRGPGYCHARCD